MIIAYGFHENPHPQCVVGGNIHKALDDKIQNVQDAMENELRSITMADVVDDLTKDKSAERNRNMPFSMRNHVRGIPSFAIDGYEDTPRKP